jgi:hypothetical protein
MTIDVTLIRSADEGGILEEVKRWQLARLANPCSTDTSRETVDNDTEGRVQEFISLIHDTEKTKRLLLREETSSRTRINRLQKFVAPKRNGKKENESPLPSPAELDSAKNEIKHLKSELPSISEKLKSISILLDEQLVQLGNVVDTADFSMDLNHNLDDFNKAREMSVVKDLGPSIYDPLFCIGGCEQSILFNEISSVEPNDVNDISSTTNGKFLLTGIGSKIWSSLMCYGRQYFSSDLLQTASFINLPGSLTIPASLAHSIFGCTKQMLGKDRTENGSACNYCNVHHCQAPSYIALGLMNQNKVFSDRMLPSIYLIQTSDRSEQTRFVHQLDRIDILALTVSNVFISRELQDDIVNFMLEFFASLLCSTKDFEQELRLVTSSEEPALRARVITPSQLDFNECRRVVVEGFLPSKGVYIELAYVSNCTDFVSRKFAMKCGGSNVHNAEYVHMLHGTMLQESAIDWMLESNLAQFEQSQGVLIPPVLENLSESLKNPGSMWLPFTRNLFKGKAGKVKVTEIKSIPEPIICGAGNASEQRNSPKEDLKDKMHEETEISEYPIFKDISGAREEALCNPYDFLPLYK